MDPEGAGGNAELARLVEAWPGLPEHIRAAIRALVESASKARLND